MIESILAAYITAQAQQPVCLPVEVFVQGFRNRFGELPLWRGISDDGKEVIMVLVNPVSGTYTVAVVNTDGIACIRANGTDFLPIPTDEKLIPGRQADGT